MKPTLVKLLPLLVIVLLGAWLRFHALADSRRFHPDEALFSTFAREASLGGHWLLPGPLDKPPLALYAGAVSMSLVAAQPNAAGVLDFAPHLGEFAARVPNTLAGILWIAALYALALRLYDRPALANLTALFAALSPFAIAYSPTAFTDGLMLLFATLALVRASDGHSVAPRRAWGASGLWLALAFASKPQALFLLPLVLGLLLVRPRRRTYRPHPISPSSASGRKDETRDARPEAPLGKGFGLSALAQAAGGPPFHRLRFLLPLACACVLLALWEAARLAQMAARGIPGEPWWALAAANNDPGGFVPLAELPERAGAWLAAGSSILGGATLLLALGVAGWLLRELWRFVSGRGGDLYQRIDYLLLAFVAGYALLHWIVAFPVYDRYWLPLLPPALILLARGGAWLWGTLARFITRPELSLAAGAVVLSILGAGWDAADGRAAVNIEWRAQAGIDQIADYLNAQPLASIVYDRWLGWPLGYYLGQWSNKRRAYYPTPEALAQAVADSYPTDPSARFLPAPDDADLAPWRAALGEAGYALEPVFEAGRFTVYAIRPLAPG